MNIFFRFLLILLILVLFANCSEKISYSGKILNNVAIDYTTLNNKNEVINIIGQPNYIDPIEKKYYYFTEQKYKKNFFDQKILNRKLIVFMFNENNTIKSFSQYDLNDQKDIEFIKDKTPNVLIQRGLIEKIFGGVGKNIPNTTQ